MKLKDYVVQIKEEDRKFLKAEMNGVEYPIRRVEIENGTVIMKIMLSDEGKPSSWDKYQLYDLLTSLDGELILALKIEDLDGTDYLIETK